MPEIETPPLTKKYFRKEIVSTPLYLKGGGKVPFVVLGDEIGILETEDPLLIKQLETAIQRRMGGVVAIEFAEYDDLKKNPPAPRLKPGSLKPWDQINPSNTSNPSVAAAAPDHQPQKTAPIKVPDKEPMLAQLADLKKKSGRLSDVMDTVKKQAAEGKL